jgi:ABC-type sugar transport system permease subunit
MTNTVVTEDTETSARAVTRVRPGLWGSRKGRKTREALLAYLFLLPAFIIVFTFGLFPLAFSAFESTLRGLNKVLGTYTGLGNYVRAIDSLAYILGFWLSLLLLYLAIRSIVLIRRESALNEDRPWILAIPAIVLGFGIALVARLVFVVIPELLAIPGKMRGQERTSELFRQYFGEAIRSDLVVNAVLAAVLVLLLGAVLTYLVYRFTNRSQRSTSYYSGFVQATLLVLGAIFLSRLVWLEIETAYAAAIEEGQDLELWTQIVTISAGFVMLLLSWLLWRSASYRQSMVATGLRLAGAAMLVVGAWILIAELPSAIGAGSEDWWTGLKATIFYSLGTVPFQLAIALLLAVLLFQAIKGRTAFRIAYFLPYIAPFIGTAAAFRILFSGRASAPVNTLLTTIGLEPLQWLNEPDGIFKILAGSSLDLPDSLTGPSLALVAIMFYGTWTFFGFNTVVFLAGLGSIPGELYEAASIDGASKWAQFRSVTLPLLSPTIYFLVLWSTIGTFKAFNHIWVLRSSAALGTSDTASVVIFLSFRENARYGYASAMAILLLLIILVLTVVNNRFASRRVFYG